jgi:hypothetical protein
LPAPKPLLYRDSLHIIHDVLIRVDPVHLDPALQRWNQAYSQHN